MILNTIPGYCFSYVRAEVAGGVRGSNYEQKCTVPVRRILLLSPEVFVLFSFPSAVGALL